jgi:hypothetical protein
VTATPVLVWVRRWQCPFCRRRRASKTATAAHIARCWSNPRNRTCKTCAHLTGHPSGQRCIPGRPCHCYDEELYCEAGQTLDNNGPFPVTDCPLWKLRTLGEAGRG